MVAQELPLFHETQPFPVGPPVGDCGRVLLSCREMSDPVLAVFESTGAYLRGHFRLTSGLHSPEYLQCAKVLQYPAHAAAFGAALGSHFAAIAAGRKIDAVVSPAMGGLIIGHEVARALGTRFVFTERDAAGQMTLRRGFAIEPGETTVVVEDVITTGGSTREVIEILNGGGATVLGAGSIIDRSGGQADVGVPRIALATLQVTAWPPESCPLCQQGLPVFKPGSRNVA
jgi:orotate phosphoribosyltransferase